MRFPVLAIVFLLFSLQVSAQQYTEAKQPRILLLLDGSSSMLEPWSNNDSRFKAAESIITKLIDSIYKVNDQVEFAMRVYGHQHPAQENNCYDTKLEVMFSKDNLTQMQLRLEALHPAGVTPIAFSLQEAAENDMIDPQRYSYSLILITDGGESCGGNICDVVKKLLEKKINFKPYILSLVDYGPLKQQYACLGEYLLVTRDNDIPAAVGTIVDGYRNLITMKNIDKKLLQAAIVNTPSILKVDIPKFKIETEVEAPPAKPIPKPLPPSKPQQVTPIVKEPAKTQDLTNRTNESSPVILPKENIASLGMLSKIKVFPLRYSTPSFQPVQMLVISLPVIPSDPKPVITPPPPKPIAVVADKPKVVVPEKPKPAEQPKLTEAKYIAEREQAVETTFELFFTDENRKQFYHTNPQIILLDSKTGKEVLKFWREVDIAGNPKPQKLPVGNYDLMVKGKGKVWRNVEIRPSNKNKYYLVVNKASLRFEYEGEPNSPVKEYYARVKRNFEAVPVVKQLCTEELEYEPGNYHIEISTIPKEQKSTDLDFDTETIIRLQRPGYVQFTNTSPFGKVNLYYELGDQFVRFYNMNINGNPNEQRTELQRGRYRVGYNNHPGTINAKETLKEFIIRTGVVTEVELN